jgi:hypothetical protein
MLGPNSYELDGLSSNDGRIRVVNDRPSQAFFVSGSRRNNFDHVCHNATFTVVNVRQVKDPASRKFRGRQPPLFSGTYPSPPK